MSWIAIIVLAVGTYAMKAVGPVVLGRRAVPMRVQRLFLLLAVALLAALIALSTLADDGRLAFDVALVAGVGAASQRMAMASVLTLAYPRFRSRVRRVPRVPRVRRVPRLTRVPRVLQRCVDAVPPRAAGP